jgi:hypothetical protein
LITLEVAIFTFIAFPLLICFLSLVGCLADSIADTTDKIVE